MDGWRIFPAVKTSGLPEDIWTPGRRMSPSAGAVSVAAIDLIGPRLNTWLVERGGVWPRCARPLDVPPAVCWSNFHAFYCPPTGDHCLRPSTHCPPSTPNVRSATSSTYRPRPTSVVRRPASIVHVHVHVHRPHRAPPAIRRPKMLRKITNASLSFTVTRLKQSS